MRPVRTPQNPLRKSLDDFAGEGNDILIGPRLAMQSRRPRFRQTLGTTHLAPDVGVALHEREEQAKLRPLHRLTDIGPSHMINHHHGGEGGKKIP